MIEAAFVTLLNGEVVVYDTKTNVNLAKYVLKGATTKCSDLLPQNLLIMGDCTKPAVHVFPLNKGEPDQGCKITLPSKPEVICALPDGTMVIVGIKNGFYMWHSGKYCFSLFFCLLMINPASLLINTGTNKVQVGSQKHFRPITVIKSSADGSLFATGAEDGMIYVWKTSELLSDIKNARIVEPFVSITDHTLPVKSICFGHCTKRIILLSISADRTFRIYDLNNKRLILTIILNVVPTCLSINRIDGKVFIGNTNGAILTVYLTAASKTNTLTEFENSSKKVTKFSSYHSKDVTSLELYTNNKTLLSGSKDFKLVTWNIDTQQVLHVLDTKTEILNIYVRFISKSIFSQTNPAVSLLQDAKEGNINDERDKVIVYKSNNDISYVFDSFNGGSSFGLGDDAILSNKIELENQLKTTAQQNYKMFSMVKDLLLS